MGQNGNGNQALATTARIGARDEVTDMKKTTTTDTTVTTPATDTVTITMVSPRAVDDTMMTAIAAGVARECAGPDGRNLDRYATSGGGRVRVVWEYDTVTGAAYVDAAFTPAALYSHDGRMIDTARTGTAWATETFRKLRDAYRAHNVALYAGKIDKLDRRAVSAARSNIREGLAYRRAGGLILKATNAAAEYTARARKALPNNASAYDADEMLEAAREASTARARAITREAPADTAPADTLTAGTLTDAATGAHAAD